jgi:hypothetical protein
VSGFRHVYDYLRDAGSGFGGSPAYDVLGVMLGITLLSSAGAKARHPWLTAMTIVDFGVTRRPHAWLGKLLVGGEGVLGALLVATPWFRGWVSFAACGVAALVFATFAVVIGRALMRGEVFPCQCFGSLSGPISRKAVFRALGFCLGAGVLATTAQQHVVAGTHAALLATTCGAAGVGLVSLLAVATQVWRLPTPDRYGDAAVLGAAAR